MKIYKYIQDNTRKKAWVEVTAFVSVDGHQVITGAEAMQQQQQQQQQHDHFSSANISDSQILHYKVTKSSLSTEMSFIIYLCALAVVTLNLLKKKLIDFIF